MTKPIFSKNVKDYWGFVWDLYFQECSKAHEVLKDMEKYDPEEYDEKIHEVAMEKILSLSLENFSILKNHEWWGRGLE